MRESIIIKQIVISVFVALCCSHSVSAQVVCSRAVDKSCYQREKGYAEDTFCTGPLCTPPDPDVPKLPACPTGSYLEKIVNPDSVISGLTPATILETGFTSFTTQNVVCVEKRLCDTCVYFPFMDEYHCVTSSGSWSTARTYQRLQGSGPSCNGTLVPIPSDFDPEGPIGIGKNSPMNGNEENVLFLLATSKQGK